MRKPSLLFALALVLCAPPADAQFTKPGPLPTLPAPVLLDTTGMFRDRFASVGTDMFVGGQPTEKALREMKDRGVTMVVNLRMPDEMQRSVPFDEQKLVQDLGMKYVNIPVRGNSDHPFSPAALAAFKDAMSNANGKVLLHCTIGFRASHMWAAYLIDRGVPDSLALANARAINLMDTMRMGSSPRQPVEELLGRTPQGLGKPPQD